MIKPRSSVLSPVSNVALGDLSQEEKSSLLNDSQNLSEEKALQFENLGDQYEQLQKIAVANQFEEIKEDERAQLKKTINNLMGDLEDPVYGLNTSQIEEPLSGQKLETNVSQYVQEPEEVKKEASPLKKSELSEDEQQRIQYMIQLENAKIKDLALVENLKYMMETGFTNFQVNFGLLNKHKNDLVVAMNCLCNGIVSDSVFGH